MNSINDYKELLVRDISTGNDGDYAATQNAPEDVTVLTRPSSASNDTPTPMSVEVVLQWLDESYALLTGDRGTCTVQAIRLAPRRQSGSTEDVIVDSMPLPEQVAHRPLFFSNFLVGDRFSVRLTDIEPPEGTLHVRVLYREVIA